MSEHTSDATPDHILPEQPLNERISELVRSVVPPGAHHTPDEDLVEEIIATALKLIKDNTDRGDVKLMNTALKELRYSHLVFSPYANYKKIAVYGSARTQPDEPNYKLAQEFSRRMAEELGWMVITGAGPGIMEAANKGAGTDASFGVNIRLPFEPGANQYISPGKVINFKYFFTRKVQFVKVSDAFALFPGGFGTLDEAFELLTLVQTGKSSLHPIVMIDAEGTGYWEAFRSLVDVLVAQGMISPNDRNLYKITSDVDDALEEIRTFFSIFHSERYVDGKLVIRLNHEIPDKLVARLSEDYADIIVRGPIRKIETTKAEQQSGDVVDLPRISFVFDRRGFGRLRGLVNEINRDG